MRHLRAEYFCQVGRLLFAQIGLLSIFLHDEAVDDVGVNTCKATLLQLLLQHVYHRRIELTFHQEYRIALLLGCLDIRILLFLIVGVEINQVAILIGLVVLNQRLVLLESKVLSLNIFQKCEVLGALVEIFLREHSVVDEDLEIIPFLFKLLAVLLEDRVQTIGYLLGDVGRNLLHVTVALKVASAYVQRNVR